MWRPEGAERVFFIFFPQFHAMLALPGGYLLGAGSVGVFFLVGVSVCSKCYHFKYCRI